MTRIFLVLATLDALALLAAFIAGVVLMLTGGGHVIFMLHFCLGLFGAVGTLLVHCLIFTYFLGTGRWVKEVGLAYELPDEPLPRLTRELKRRTFPPALIAMLITIATVAAGGGRLWQEWPWYIHGSMAIVTLLVNGWAYVVEYRNVRSNGRAIDDVLIEVDRIRVARGLPTNAEALRDEM